MKIRAYLDIETTGLSFCFSEITVIGVAVEHCADLRVTQLVGQEISDLKVFEILAGVEELYTYNGSRFDLPFIKAALRIDLKTRFRHRDLMYDCWRNNLKGGLKVVEQTLGINRKLKNIDGRMAVKLWWHYKNNNNPNALKTLLDYNAEDIINLKALRQILRVN